MLTTVPSWPHQGALEATLDVWDVQTGIVIRRIGTQCYGKIMFHGDQNTITLFREDGIFYAYDTFNGTQLYQGKIPSSPGPGLGAHWAHGDALRFATSLEADGKLVIYIYELQPTSIPPLRVISSFPVPPHSGKFSFSPVSSHASFVTETELAILNAQDPKVLLQPRVTRADLLPPGQFSPDGRFFVCGTLGGEISVWRNTPTGYMPWSSLRPRSPFEEFSWSPTSISILCWGSEGIQLLDPDNCLTSLSPGEAESHRLRGDHLAAYSVDGTHIATAQEDGGVVTVLDCLSGTSQQFTDMDMRIQDIKIVDNTIFAADTRKLVGWDLRTGGTVSGSHGTRRVTVNKTLAIDPYAQYLTLSRDCSQIAFSKRMNIFRYDVKTRKTFRKRMGDWIAGIRFSSDGRQLWSVGMDGGYDCVGLETAGDWSSVKVFNGSPEDGQLLFNCSSPHGYHVGTASCWVVDSGGGKVLWLPPSWREAWQGDNRWDGNFLALLGNHHPEPIIIAFRT